MELADHGTTGYPEIGFTCGVFGPTVITFDGAVLERFCLKPDAQSIRYHRSMITARLHAPDRKGFVKLDVGLRAGPGGFDNWIALPEAHVVEPLLARLAQAGVPVSRGG